MRLKVEHLSKDRDAPPVWLWSSKTGATPDDVDRFWQAFSRRFDLEHTFRFAKQTLGWTTPKLRTPDAADRWTWILIVAHTQLRLARPLAADLRRPWENPPPPTGSPRPGSAEGFGTSAFTSPAQLLVTGLVWTVDRVLVLVVGGWLAARSSVSGRPRWWSARAVRAAAWSRNARTARARCGSPVLQVGEGVLARRPEFSIRS